MDEKILSKALLNRQREASSMCFQEIQKNFKKAKDLNEPFFNDLLKRNSSTENDIKKLTSSEIIDEHDEIIRKTELEKLEKFKKENVDVTKTKAFTHLVN